MIDASRHLLCVARALVLALLVLGVLVKPLLVSAHELHEMAHALQTDADGGTDADDARQADVLHSVDCCLHASGIGVGTPGWQPPAVSQAPPCLILQRPPPPACARPLRPPIVSG